MRATRQPVCLALLTALAGTATASTLQLEPVSIRLTPTARAAVMQLRNSGSEPMHVQVRAFRWEQQQGEDRLSATDDLRVSPPIQTIPAGTEQYVRVLLAEALLPQGEESFRLIVDELPRAPAADGQVRMLIRYSVPVMVRPSGLRAPELRFRIVHDGDQTLLEAENRGGQGAQLAEMQFTTADGATIRVNRGLYGYVLAGQMRRWPLSLPPDAIGRATGIDAHVDGKASRYALEVAR